MIVGVRPSDLTLDTGDWGTGHVRQSRATLTADVRVVEPLGSELHAIFSIDAPTAGGRALTHGGRGCG